MKITAARMCCGLFLYYYVVTVSLRRGIYKSAEATDPKGIAPRIRGGHSQASPRRGIYKLVEAVDPYGAASQKCKSSAFQ